jgi:hypothetical protein
MGRDTYTPGGGGSAGLTRGYIIYTALRCASRHAAIYQHAAAARCQRGRGDVSAGRRDVSAGGDGKSPAESGAWSNL